MLEVDPDVIAPEVLISRLRQRLGHEAAPVVLEPVEDAKVLLDDVRELQARWPVGEDVTISSHRRVLGPAIVFGKKVVRKVVRWYVDARWSRQADFNQHATRAAGDMVSYMTQLAETQHELRKDVERLKQMTDTLREENAYLRKQMADHSLLRPAEPTQGADAIDYVSFEDTFRGSREGVMAHFEPFVEIFVRAAEGGGRVLDIGCGRGEMVELLMARRVDVLGIDLNPAMITFCQANNLPAQVGDAQGYLETVADASLAGIFMSQVIEHLDTPAWMSFLQLAHRKLRPGGKLLIETINPGSFYALALAFFKDLTHLRPIHPETLQFVMKAKGYQDVEVLMLSPHPAMAELEGKDALSRALAESVLGHMDYAVLGTR